MNKKIGLFTMHRSLNYGTILQALATQQLLKKHGYEVEVIDYRPAYTENTLTMPKLSSAGLKRNLGCLYVRCVEGRARKKKIDRFLQFIKQIKVSPSCYPTAADVAHARWDDYDVLISGSDQLWNPYIVGDDVTYLLPDFPVRKISYASSFGITEFPQRYKEQYGRYLGQFEVLLAREEQGVALLQELWGISAQTVLDPTLMLEPKEWNNYAAEVPRLPKQGYILTYYMIESPLCGQITRRLQTLTGLPVVNLKPTKKQVMLRQGINMTDAGPAEFLQCYRQARFVVTNSFHGTAFALNYGLPLYSTPLPIRTKSLNSRLVNLLTLTGQQSRWIDSEEKLDTITTQPLDAQAAHCLEALRRQSQSRLICAIERMGNDENL